MRSRTQTTRMGRGRQTRDGNRYVLAEAAEPGGLGGRQPPQLLKNSRENRFFLHKSMKKAGSAPPKTQESHLSPPNLKSFRRPCVLDAVLSLEQFVLVRH